MKILQFKCHLLSDVIINQKAATVGPQASLDFIPGNNFLGIAANYLYNKYSSDPHTTWLLFHSGKVRFGDAHPLFLKDGIYIRSLRIPAAMYYPKLKKPTEECYIYHWINDFESIVDKQIKQCRSGFYAFYQGKGEKIDINKTFAIKSAYDPVNRRSQDQKMYGYESIDKGTLYTFEVACDDDISESLQQDIIYSLTNGVKRVGRSRTAQYGLIKNEYLENIQFQDIPVNRPVQNIEVIYAESRLIFLDEFGLPTYTPTVQQLGFNNAKSRILWDKSQIRTFQYAPWNSIRQARDPDRCGIEKGSVFVIQSFDDPVISPFGYLGSYQNEGFGKVIYNPIFLSAGTNGKSLCCLNDNKPTTDIPNQQVSSPMEKRDNYVLQYLVTRMEKEQLEQTVYQLVDDFITTNKSLFISSKDDFSAQWGQIRSIATTCATKKILIESISNYLTKGIAKNKWEEYHRFHVFKTFMEKLTDQNALLAVINLSSEMAKICKKI